MINDLSIIWKTRFWPFSKFSRPKSKKNVFCKPFAQLYHGHFKPSLRSLAWKMCKWIHFVWFPLKLDLPAPVSRTGGSKGKNSLVPLTSFVITQQNQKTVASNRIGRAYQKRTPLESDNWIGTPYHTTESKSRSGQQNILSVSDRATQMLKLGRLN